MNNKNIRIFVHEVFGDLRVFEDARGELWFSAVDAYKTLALDHKVLQRIPDGDKCANAFPAKRSNRRSTGVTLAGLFSLILASKKKEAMEYKTWVTHVVLPAIYEDGGYILGQETLPESERTALQKRVKDLAEQVERANAGKLKLSDWLRESDDREYGHICKINELREELAAIRESQEALAAMLLDPAKVKEYLRKLERAVRVDADAKAKIAADELEARIPYAKPEPDPDPDPIVIMPDGLRVPLSEYLAERAAKRGC